MKWEPGEREEARKDGESEKMIIDELILNERMEREGEKSGQQSSSSLCFFSSWGQ